MSRSRRVVLPTLLSSSLALGGAGLLLAEPGRAEPVPTEYSASASADLWQVTRIDRDLADTAPATTVDLAAFGVDGVLTSTGTPRSRAEAANLSGSSADGQAARRTALSEATKAADTSGPTSGVAPAGGIAGLVDLQQAVLGARGRWVGDAGCLATADGLADATAAGSGASLAASAVPDGASGPVIVLPTGLPTGLPTESPSSTPTGLPTSLPTGSPTIPTDDPTELPTELPTSGLPTILPTLPTEPPTTVLPTLPLAPAKAVAPAAASATRDVALATLAAGTVQQRIDLPLRNDATRDDRGVRATTIGTVKDLSAPAMTFLGGEVRLRLTRAATLTAYADGVHPSVVQWSPPGLVVEVAGQSATYPLPADGSPVSVPYSRNGDVTLTLTAGQLQDEVESATGLVASGRASVAHMVVRNGDAVAMEGDLMPMSVEAKAPGGGVQCPAPDTDGDGLDDDLEAQLHTNPGLRDTDHDKLSDGREYLTYKTNPRRADTDKDKLTDGQEVRKFDTKPRKSDTDRDHLKDGVEVRKYKTNPRRKDTDRDGVPDGKEVRHHTDPRDRRDH